MKLKILSIIILSILVTGCNKGKKVDLELKTFLPTEGHYFQYEITFSYKDFTKKITKQEKIIMPGENNCLNIKEYQILNKEEIKELPKELKKMLDKERFFNGEATLCSNKNSIFYKDGETILVKNKKWKQLDIYENKDIESTCEISSVSKRTILNKKRKTVHISCRYKDKIKTDFFMAEGIGTYKGIYEVNDNKVEMILKNVERSSTRTKIN